MKTKMKMITAVLLGVFVVMTACKKEEANDDDNNNTSYDNSTAPKNNAVIENAYEEMSNMSDQAINGALVFYQSNKVKVYYADGKNNQVIDKEACSVIITIDTTSSPKSVTIDWGATNCDCLDGKQRRGKLVTTFTGQYHNPGTVITHTPVDYYVNDNHIEGTRSVTNMGVNSNNHPYFNIEINGVVTLTNGEVYTYESSRVRTWSVGYDTPFNYWDDEYDITGDAEASSTLGNGYVAEIVTALHVKVGCAYIMSGVLDFTPTNKPTRTINYGDGACDANFTVTINGQTYTVIYQ